MDCVLSAGIGQAEREEMLHGLDARRAKRARGQALLEAGGPVREKLLAHPSECAREAGGRRFDIPLRGRSLRPPCAWTAAR